MEVEAIEGIADPVDRAVAAQEAMARAQGDLVALAEIRRRAVAELRAEGSTWEEIGALLGITRGQAANVLRRPRRRR